MRIEFLTQVDPLYILPFFEEFFANYSNQFEIAQVSCCATMGKRSRRQLAAELFALYGVTGSAKIATRLAMSSLLSRMPRDRNSSKFYSLQQLCGAFGVAYERIGNPNQKAFVDSVRQRAVDVLVSVACPFILKPAILAAPKRCCINIHHAPLPRYKGMMPTFWQMFHGETSVGVTVHYMDEGLDTGKILLQESTPIPPGETLDGLIRRSKRHGAHCVAKVLDQIGTDTVQASQPSGESSYYTFPTIQEIKHFKDKGLRTI